MADVVERVARAIYGGDDARWQRNRNTQGVHHATFQARAAVAEFAKWHDEMAKGMTAAARQIDEDWVKPCTDPEDRRSNIEDRDNHFEIARWHEGLTMTLRRQIDAALKEGE